MTRAAGICKGFALSDSSTKYMHTAYIHSTARTDYERSNLHNCGAHTAALAGSCTMPAAPCPSLAPGPPHHLAHDERPSGHAHSEYISLKTHSVICEGHPSRGASRHRIANLQVRKSFEAMHARTEGQAQQPQLYAGCRQRRHGRREEHALVIRVRCHEQDSQRRATAWLHAPARR